MSQLTTAARDNVSPSKKIPVGFSSLPDVMVTLICEFFEFPWLELVPLRLVSTTFNRVIDSMCANRREIVLRDAGSRAVLHHFLLPRVTDRLHTLVLVNGIIGYSDRERRDQLKQAAARPRDQRRADRALANVKPTDLESTTWFPSLLGCCPSLRRLILEVFCDVPLCCAIVEALRKCHKLEELKLYYCLPWFCMTADGDEQTIIETALAAFVTTIKQLPALRVFDVDGTFLDNPSSKEVIWSTLPHCHALTHLHVSYGRHAKSIPKQTALINTLSAALANMPLLTSLEISDTGNWSTDDVRTLFTNGIAKLCALKHLRCLLISMTLHADDISSVSSALSSLTQLEELDMTFCALSEFALALAPALRHLTRLRKLALANGMISGQAAQALGKELHHCQLLEEFEIHDNPLGDSGAAAILRGIGTVPSLCTRIKHLEMKSTGAGNEAAIALVQLIPSLSALQYVDFGIDFRGAEGWRALGLNIIPDPRRPLSSVVNIQLNDGRKVCIL